jgi:superfamily I DNA and/or RNA helicase
MQSGRWTVLVGDQQQLEPHHRPVVVSVFAARTRVPQREIIRSDFERVFASRYGVRAGRTLKDQYRMLPPIGRLVSRAFYGGQLSHRRNDPVIEPSALPRSLEKPIAWISTNSLGGQAHQRSASDGRSLVNEVEADAIITLLRELDGHEPFRRWLKAQSVYRHPIGIICTYAAQRDLIRRRLPAAGLAAIVREACKIDTVDSYQGKENPIVIVSLVRNNADGAIENGAATIRAGFMERPNRINVAISRAMDRLVLVGADRGWRSSGPMSATAAAFREEMCAGHAELLDAAVLLGASTAAEAPRRSARPKAKEAQ